MAKKQTKQKTHGGVRAGSGRKPIADKKVTVAIYPHASRVISLGADAVKDIAIQAIEKAFKKTLTKSKNNFGKDLEISR